MPKCTNIKEDLNRLKNILSDNEKYIKDKIDAIKMFHNDTGLDMFAEYLHTLERAHELIINRVKISSMIKKVTPFVLDGDSYAYGKNGDNYEVYNINTAELVYSSKTEPSNAEVLKALDERLQSSEPKTLSQRILHTIRKQYPIDDSGSIDIHRKLFRAKNSDTLFNSTNMPFTDNTVKLSARLEKIIDYIPKSIREVIIGDDIDARNEMDAQFQILAGIMENINVPPERVWNVKFKLDENGNYIADGTLYSPNYLYLLGDIVEKENNNNDPLVPDTYYELKLDSQIEEIVRFYSMKAIVDLKAMIENFQNLDPKDIADEIGVSIDEATQLKEKFFSNGMLPASYIMSNISKDAFNALDISVSRDVSIKIKEGITKSLDAMIRATLVNNGLVIDINSKENIDALAKNNLKNKRLSQSKYRVALGYEKQRISDSFKIGGKAQKIFKINTEKFMIGKENALDPISKIMNKLKYAAPTHSRGLATAIPAIPGRRMLKSSYDISKENYEFIKTQSATKWRFKKDFHDFVKLYDKNKKLALISAGYIDNFDGYQVSEIERLRAINDKIEREVDLLVTMYKNSKDFIENGFYLEWGQAKNGRPTIVSDINPQESKFHRSMIEQEGHSSLIYIKDIRRDTDTIKMFKFALAQAFDLDPDKNSDLTVIKTIDDMFDFNAGEGVVVKDDSNLGSAIKKIIDGNLSDEEYAYALNTIYNEGEGNHGVQAAKTLKRLNEWLKSDTSSPFQNELTIETDAITSGMMLTLMQIFDKSSIDLLAKGGIYTEDTLNKWSEYTKYWLALKYKKEDIPFKEIKFTASALIEAGVYHQSIIDSNNIMDKLPSDFKVDDKFKKMIAEPAFHDLYKTLGTHMLENIIQSKTNIENRLNNTKNENEKILLSSALALLNSIGELTPSALRNIAKSPVMVYVYGATLGSIKQKLAHSVAKEQFIKDIKTIKKLYGKIDRGESVELDNAMTYVELLIESYVRSGGTLKYKQYDKTGRFHYMSNEDVQKLSLHEQYMLIDIDSEFVNHMQKITDMTFGDAIGEAFKQAFPSVDKYRSRLKAAELITFMLFNARYKAELQRIKQERHTISKADIDEMMSNLFNEGYSHDILVNGEPNDQALPLEKHGMSGDVDSASYVFKFDPNIKRNPGESDASFKKRINEQHRMHSMLESLEQIVNSGAAPTISIHKRDGMIIVKAIGSNPWLSIYDAIVQASHPKNVEKSTTEYNIATIDVSSQSDIIYDAYKKLSNMLDNLNERLKSDNPGVSGQAKYEYDLIFSMVSPVRKVEQKITMSEHREQVLRMTNISKLTTHDKSFGIKWGIEYDGVDGNLENVELFKKSSTYSEGNTKITINEYYTDSKFRDEDLSKTSKIVEYPDGQVSVYETHRIYNDKLKDWKIVSFNYSYDIADGDPILNATPENPFAAETRLLTIDKNSKPIVSKIIKDSEVIYEKNYLNNDISQEINHTGITLNRMIELVDNIEKDRKERHKNLNQVLYSNHSGMSNIGPTKVESKVGEYKPLNKFKILKFVKDINSYSIDQKLGFIKDSIKSFIKNADKEKHKDAVTYAWLVQYASNEGKDMSAIGIPNTFKNVSIESIESSPTAHHLIGNIFSIIGSMNPKTYTKNDNAIVVYGKNNPIRKDGKPTAQYKSIDAAIGAGSTITMISPEYFSGSSPDAYANGEIIKDYIESKGYTALESEFNGVKFLKFIKSESDERLGSTIEEISDKMSEYIRKIWSLTDVKC